MHFIFPLRWRLLALTLLIAIPAFILIYLTNIEQRKSAAQEAQDDALHLVRNIAAGQNQFIEETRMLMTMLARVPQLHPGQPAECNAFLADLQKDLPYNFVGVATRSGDVVCGSPVPQSDSNVSDRVYYQRAMFTRGFAASDFQIGRRTGKPLLVFATPIFAPSDEPEEGLAQITPIEGLVLVSIELEWLQQEIAAASLP